MQGPDAQPTEVQAGPLTLRLCPDPRGPMLDEDDVGLESLYWLVGVSCLAGEDDADEIYQATQSGAAYYDHVLQVRPLDEDDDLEAAKRFWHAKTGCDLEGELRYVQVASDQPLILPADVLRDLARQLKQMREAHHFAPPWLFVPDAVWSWADNSERFRLNEIDARLGDGECDDAQLASSGLRCPAQAESKIRTLLDWGAFVAAEHYAAFLAQSDVIDDPPWLFHGQPGKNLPHPSERAVLATLEQAAAAIDRDEAALDGRPEPSELIGRRATLLRELDAHGLMSIYNCRKKRNWLDRWEFAKLHHLYEAFMSAADYLSSDERRRYNPDATASHLLQAPVCLDAFRAGAIRPPGNVSLHAWLSWGEHLLATYGPGPEVQSDQGEFPYHDQDGLIIVLWRRDAGIPALRYLSLREPTDG